MSIGGVLVAGSNFGQQELRKNGFTGARDSCLLSVAWPLPNCMSPSRPPRCSSAVLLFEKYAHSYGRCVMHASHSAIVSAQVHCRACNFP